MATLIGILKGLGFQVCDDWSLEDGFEKIAVYATWGEWNHVARQLKDGQWTSKIGGLLDMTHAELDSLTDSDYGDVACFLKKPIGVEHDETKNTGAKEA
jgi:hypothetical protein